MKRWLLSSLTRPLSLESRDPPQFAVVFRVARARFSSGDSDRVFVDIEADMEFDFHGVVLICGFIETENVKELSRARDLAVSILVEDGQDDVIQFNKHNSYDFQKE